jgi:hypothetical protein
MSKFMIVGAPLHLLEKDMIVPGSITGTCGRCSTTVSLSPSSQEVLAEKVDHELVCLDCWFSNVESGEEFKIITSPAQIKEITDYYENRPDTSNTN